MGVYSKTAWLPCCGWRHPGPCAEEVPSSYPSVTKTPLDKFYPAPIAPFPEHRAGPRLARFALLVAAKESLTLTLTLTRLVFTIQMLIGNLSARVGSFGFPRSWHFYSFFIFIILAFLSVGQILTTTGRLVLFITPPTHTHTKPALKYFSCKFSSLRLFDS